MDGFLIIDKPGGMTSRDAVNIVQRWFPRGTRIGHTGTLDPLATGVLVLCIGKATRLADRVQAMAKTYQTRILFGATSDTDDADGVIKAQSNVPPTDVDSIRTILPRYTGVIEQRPPMYSAVKVQGQRAYHKARLGEQFELSPRPVRIDALHLDHFDWPFLDLTIQCGKGTYIRSLARDLGSALGVGGLVQTLRRTKIGHFAVENALQLCCEAEEAQSRLMPLDSMKTDAD